MPPPFRGAPTRIGRIILAAFGAPFVLGALALLGAVVFGDDTGGEKLTLAIAAFICAAAGCLVWAPAFPGVVNRIMESDNRWVKAARSHSARSVMGGMIAAMGLVPIVAAVGILPTDESAWHAPRWVGGVAGGLFFVAGLYLLSKPAVDRLDPWLRKQIMGLFPLLIFTGMAAISGWIAFAPGERHFEGGISSSLAGTGWSESGEILGRIAFGAGAIILVVITLIGWWRYLRGRW